MSNKRERITLDLKPNQMLVLTELKESLNTNYSTLIRAIIQDFLTRNDDVLMRITMSKKGELDAIPEPTEEEQEEYFPFE